MAWQGLGGQIQAGSIYFFRQVIKRHAQQMHDELVITIESMCVISPKN